jgi:hypothetical protein
MPSNIENSGVLHRLQEVRNAHHIEKVVCSAGMDDGGGPQPLPKTQWA